MLRQCGSETIGEGEDAVTLPTFVLLGEVQADRHADAWEQAKALPGAIEQPAAPIDGVLQGKDAPEWCGYMMIPASRVKHFNARARWTLADEVEGL